MRAPGRGLAAATIVVLALVWGTTWAAIRVSLVGIPPFTGVALRFAFAAALLVVLARILGVPIRAASRRERRLRLAHAVLSFCVSYGVVFWAEQWVPSGLASVLFATFTFFVVVMAHFWLPGERMTPSSTVGVALGLVGIGVIYAEDFETLGGRQVLVAAIVMLVSPLAAAAANVLVKRWGEGIHPVSLNAVAMGVASGIMGVVALATERGREVVFDLPSVAALLYLAVFGSAITFVLYFWLLQHMPVGRLSLIAYATPLVAIAIGATFMDEPLTPRTLAGSAFVVVGVALAAGRKALKVEGRTLNV